MKVRDSLNDCLALRYRFLFILAAAVWLIHAGYRVKTGIKGIEVFAVQLILCNPKRFTETGR